MGQFKINNGKHITCLFENLPNVAKMVFRYYDKPEYDRCIFVLNYALDRASISALRKDHGYSRVIFYNLEHLTAAKYFAQSNTWREYLIGTLYGYDEIWDFLIENYEMYPDDLRDRYRFMPMRYAGDPVTDCEKLFDIFFAGVIDTRVRHDFASKANYLYMDNQLSVVIASGLWGAECDDLMRRARYVLDYPHYRLTGNTQNCVRIHDALCNNVPVISYTDTSRVINYFGGIISVINSVDGFSQEKTYNIVRSQPVNNVAELYKDLTGSDADYEKYRSALLSMYF